MRLIAINPTAEDTFWGRLWANTLNSKEGLFSKSDAVVFVHGYNVSFEEAALRAAQIGFDISVNGVMAFFSWPSKGTLEGYLADSASIEASEPAITEFLIRFAAMNGATKRVHIIAHSMGNRGVLRAINRIASEAEKASGVKFGQFILAAADVDGDTFANLAACYRQMGDRTTLYVSSRDRAVEASKWVHSFRRVGFTPPITVIDGIDTVNVSNIDLTLLGHGYVGKARSVLEDIHSLIKMQSAPDQRFGLDEQLHPKGPRIGKLRNSQDANATAIVQLVERRS